MRPTKTQMDQHLYSDKKSDVTNKHTQLSTKYDNLMPNVYQNIVRVRLTACSVAERLFYL